MVQQRVAADTISGLGLGTTENPAGHSPAGTRTSAARRDGVLAAAGLRSGPGALFGTVHARARRRAYLEAFRGDLGAARLASPVVAGLQALERPIEFGYVFARSIQEGGHMRAFEGGARSLRVVLVVGRDEGVSLHQPVEFPAQGRDLRDRAGSRARQQIPHIG